MQEVPGSNPGGPTKCNWTTAYRPHFCWQRTKRTLASASPTRRLSPADNRSRNDLEAATFGGVLDKVIMDASTSASPQLRYRRPERGLLAAKNDVANEQLKSGTDWCLRRPYAFRGIRESGSECIQRPRAWERLMSSILRPNCSRNRHQDEIDDTNRATHLARLCARRDLPSA